MRGSAGDGMPKINLGITGSVEVGITGLKNAIAIGDPVISHFKKLLIMQ